MNAIGIYINHVNKTKSEIEAEMKYIAERNAELERIIREAKEAKKELEVNRAKMAELAQMYVNMREDI